MKMDEREGGTLASDIISVDYKAVCEDLEYELQVLRDKNEKYRKALLNLASKF